MLQAVSTFPPQRGEPRPTEAEGLSHAPGCAASSLKVQPVCCILRCPGRTLLIHSKAYFLQKKKSGPIDHSQERSLKYRLGPQPQMVASEPRLRERGTPPHIHTHTISLECSQQPACDRYRCSEPPWPSINHVLGLVLGDSDSTPETEKDYNWPANLSPDISHIGRTLLASWPPFSRLILICRASLWCCVAGCPCVFSGTHSWKDTLLCSPLPPADSAFAVSYPAPQFSS